MLEKFLIESAKTIGEQCLKNMQQTPSAQEIKTETRHIKEDVKTKGESQKPETFVIPPKNIEQNHNINLVNAYGRNKRLSVMVICAVVGLIICLLILTLFRGNLSGEAIGIISTISGLFGACLKDAYSFEFGSSRGSREKDERISATIIERLKN